MNEQLTPEQRQKFAAWIDAKTSLVGKCPICGTRNWSILDHFIDLPIFRGGNLVVGGPSYPSVGMICQNCGNTHLINAVVSGIIPNDSADSKPSGNNSDG